MNKKGQSDFAIGLVVGLIIVTFIAVIGLLFYSFGVVETEKASANIDQNQDNQPVILMMNKPDTQKPIETKPVERGYLDYTDYKRETDDQCTVYVRNTGDVAAFFTVEFYLEDTNSSDERETDREKYIVPGDRESFTVSMDEDESCDYEVYPDRYDRYLDTMDNYDYYRYLRNLDDDCDDDPCD